MQTSFNQKCLFACLVIFVNLEKAYRNYVDKHKSSPNLLFIDEKVFFELIRNQNEYSSFRFSPELNHYTFFGCLVIKMYGQCFGYKFYEFDDLFLNPDLIDF